MNARLLDPEVTRFIHTYSGDLSKLAFSGSPFKDVTVQELMQQIESRRKIEKKLPTWFAATNIYYPPKLNLEQTSSEITAAYKASLVSGTAMADLTGGFGVDAYYFAETFKKVHHFEHYKELSAIAAHNFKVLGKNNITIFSEDGMAQVETLVYDLIYVDPSRRHESKGKVFFLKDCEPNIPHHLPLLLSQSDTLLIKTSPMLDISVGLSELSQVQDIHIVAVDNEVKEVLWLIKKGFKGNPTVTTINFTKQETQKFSFVWGTSSESEYALPQHFLYEPNAAIMKSGAFELVSEAFQVKKLHKHTHLYTSDTLVPFPGRIFTVEEVIPYSKQHCKAAFTFRKANITTRNFPESIAVLRKKWKLKEGGDRYLFFTTGPDDQKLVVVCRKTN